MLTPLALFLPLEHTYLAPVLAVALVPVAAELGDYVLQTHRMQAKTSSWRWALLHAAVYTLPFGALTLDPVALAIIGGTHALIDRYRLGAVWCRWAGVGQPGALDRVLNRRFGSRAPLPGMAPEWMRIWLSIKADNAMHRVIEVGALLLALWRQAG